MNYCFRIVAIAVIAIGFTLTSFSQTEILTPNKAITFTISENQTKTFVLDMKTDDYAEITWLANENLHFSFAFMDSNGKALSIGDSTVNETALFIAPKNDKFTFLVKYENSPELKGSQKISLEYNNKFQLPRTAKLKDFRKINGYDVRILFVPEGKEMFGDDYLLFEKGGKLKSVLKSTGTADFIGFTFPDNFLEAKTPAAKKSVNLIKTTIDKTGDGIPDVMVNYFSGGAHCCSSTYFFNLGETVELVDILDTGNADLVAIGANPKGGLRFETGENAFAYWNTCFACSPMPSVILEFQNGELKPNFDLLKKPAPSLASIKEKARKASLKINNDPYTEVGLDFDEAFWDEMLDLIYTGHEDLAWQYFEFVWPTRKPGKEKFLSDFKEQLAESYYGSRSINTANNVRNAMRAFEKAYEKIKEN